MIRIGITKEFSLEIAPTMMEQLEQIFTKGIHTSFTDSGVYFSIELKPFLLRHFEEPYWEPLGSLRYYRWVLVVGEHQAVSKEFTKLSDLFWMSPFGKLVIFPYIRNSTAPLSYIPHVVFDNDGNIESVGPGQNSTEERVLERVRQMGLLSLYENIIWEPKDSFDAPVL
jgi:hypothetical protein